MAQYGQTHCVAPFGALSDATGPGVLEQPGCMDASITALAGRFHMTLTGMKKHAGVLEQAGPVSSENFVETAGKTLLVVHDLYPSKEARDFGSTGAMPETFDQLDGLLASLGSRTKTK
jgi:hypothetical protein